MWSRSKVVELLIGDDEGFKAKRKWAWAGLLVGYLRHQLLPKAYIYSFANHQ